MEYIKVSSSYFSLSCSSSSLHLEKEADPVAGLLRMMSLTVRKNSYNNDRVARTDPGDMDDIKAKASSYIAQYPVLRTVQSTLHFTSLTDLFTQTPSRLLWEASSHMLQLMREGCSYTYPPLSTARYSFIQLSELEQCRVKKLAQGFNAVARIRTRVLVLESLKLYP